MAAGISWCEEGGVFMTLRRLRNRLISLAAARRGGRSRPFGARSGLPRLLSVFLCAALLVSAAILGSGMQNKIMEMAGAIGTREAQRAVSQMAFESIEKVMAQENITYDSLSVLSKDDAGKICAISTDTILLSRLQSLVLLDISGKLGDFSGRSVRVALGSLTKFAPLFDLGPRIPVRLTAAGSVTARVNSEISGAGINQTRHHIAMEIAIPIEIFVGLSRASCEVSVKVPVAETVVIGNIPQNYTYVTDSESSTIGKINDYGQNDT